MAKRRTKKQKQNAKQNFTISWGDKLDLPTTQKDVKGEKKSVVSGQTSKNNSYKKPNYSDQVMSLALIKHDLIKSLFIASLIMALEVMIYSFWK